ncbi:MAG: hypothetical protein ACRD2I_20660 [Vicinamibacterales bacterium]
MIGVATTAGGSVEVGLAWVLLALAAVTGTLMIAVGMFEELAEIFRSAWSRSVRR